MREVQGLVEPQVAASPQTGSRDVAFIAAVLGSLLLMGSSFVAAKVLLLDDFPALLLAGWRFLLAAAVTLLVLVLFLRVSLSDLFPPNFGMRHYATVGIIGLLQTTAAIGLLYLAMRRISATTAAVLMFTNAIWILTERLFLREAALRGRVTGQVLHIGGVILAIQVGSDGFTNANAVLGELTAVVAACCWAAATLVQRRAALALGTLVLHFWQTLVGAIALLVVGYLSGERWPPSMTGVQVGHFLWLVIAGSAVAFGLWLFALGRSRQTHASGLLFFVPLVALILSHLVFHTRLVGWQAAAGALIGLGAWLDSRRSPPEFVPPP